MSESYRSAARGLVALHRLMAAGRDDTPEAEAIRDAMDGPWRRLSAEERVRLGRLSEGLYLLAAALRGDRAMEELGRYRHWMRYAYQIAAKSSDRSTQNGALVLPACDAFVSGCNEHVAGVDRGDPAVHERPLKYAVTGHAAEAAICTAARDGRRLNGGTMVACWAACPPCARLIIQAGIVRVVVHGERMDATPERRRPDVDLGLKMLADAGVEVVRLEGPVDAGVAILFDGRRIEV